MTKDRSRERRKGVLSPSLYGDLLDAAGDVIVTTDRAGNCTAVSAAVESLLGYPPTDLLGKNTIVLVPAAWRRSVRAFYGRQLRTQTMQTRFEFPVVTRAGEEKWVEQIAMLLLEAGQVVGLRSLLRDLSPRRGAQPDGHEAGAEGSPPENALRESEERYRKLVENATDIIFTLDTAMNFTSLNPAFETVTGWRSEDWLNRPFTDLIYPDDKVLAQIQNALVTAPGEVVAPFELRLHSASGAVVIGEFKIRQQCSSGREVGTLGIARDITRRKRSEAERDLYINRLEVLQNVDTELSQNLQVDHVLEMALDAAVRLSQADAGAIHLLEGDQMWVAQVIGDYPRTLVGSRVPLDRGIIGRVMHSQQPEWVIDVTYDPDYLAHVKATRSQITIPLIARERTIGVLNVQTSQPEHFSQRIFDFVKLLTARIATAIDNARLYQVSQNQLSELQAVYQQVSELEQLKTEIIRVAAHDLRNPLGVVSGYTQMLGWELDAQLSDRHRDHLRMIRQSVDRIDKITRDILTLERIEQMARGVLAESVDLRDMVAQAFDEYRGLAADKGLDYQLNNAPGAVVVKGDTIFLRESIGNLLSNAIKFTPGGGSVRVCLLDDHGQAVFEVQDSGYGIPQESQDGLFQPFFRAVTKETKSIRGTGLGLHLVKRIVERHNGQMRFSSVYGQGSVFGFEIPMAAKPAKANTGSKNRPKRKGRNAAVS